MLNASDVYRGHAAWLIFRQAEPLYTLGRYQVAVLNHRTSDSPREIAVFNQHNETLVLFGPNAIVSAALEAGVNEPAAGLIQVTVDPPVSEAPEVGAHD